MNDFIDTNRRIAGKVRKLRRQKLKGRRKGGFHAALQYFVAPQSKLLYLVNNKVACTSIKFALHHRETGSALPDIVSDIGNHPDVRKFRARQPPTDPDQYFKFTFVRNPIDRVRSFYINKFLDFGKIQSHGFEFEYYLGGIFRPYERFDSVVDKICDIPDEYADRHFISQHTQLVARQPFELDFVGKIETLTTDFSLLERRFSLPPLTRRNASGAKFEVDELFTRKILEKLARRYGKDIEFYGYQEAYELAWEVAG